MSDASHADTAHTLSHFLRDPHFSPSLFPAHFSARDNVDVHFAYICRAHAAFEARFGASLGAASSAVDGFDTAWAKCAAAELHPHVQVRAPPSGHVRALCCVVLLRR
jgi:hypothetical protein